MMDRVINVVVAGALVGLFVGTAVLVAAGLVAPVGKVVAAVT